MLEAYGGLDEAIGYLGEGPMRTGLAFPDAVGGVHGAVAVLAALWERGLTDAAVHVDLSQLETLLSVTGEQLLVTSADGAAPPRPGNRSADHAPQGVYPCAGDDRWVAVTVGGDDEWRRLVTLLADPTLVDLAGADLAGRLREHDAIDAAIVRWTADRDPFVAAGRLQEARIAAAPAFTNGDLVDDPHLASRGFIVEWDQPDVGPRAVPRLPHPLRTIAGAHRPRPHPGPAQPGRPHRARPRRRGDRDARSRGTSSATNHPWPDCPASPVWSSRRALAHLADAAGARARSADRRAAGARPAPVGGDAAALLRLQRDAGNAAVSAALRMPTVQRRLELRGSPTDVGTVMKLLQRASGLDLRRDAKGMVTMTGVVRTPASTTLQTHLMLIVGDQARTAKVSLTQSGDDIFIGSFPDEAGDRTQVVRVDHILALEQGVRGAGHAALIHELMENYEAQAVPADDWDDAFDRAHKTAGQAEDATLAELQVAAGETPSGGRLNSYSTKVERPRSGGRTTQRVTVQIETHERDYVVYEEVTVRGADRLTAKRVPSTALGAFTISGFTATSSQLPAGAGSTLQKIADLLDADRTAGVVIRASTTPNAYRRAQSWTATLRRKLRELIAGSATARRDRMGTGIPASGANEVEVTVRRPQSL